MVILVLILMLAGSVYAKGVIVPDKIVTYKTVSCPESEKVEGNVFSDNRDYMHIEQANK